MAIRATVLRAGVLALALLGGCDERRTGPIAVSAIGGPPRLVNPNLEPLDAASAFYLGAVAQGLVRFDASGQIEPALAQSWIVSDDGLRYTFRIARLEWKPGDPVKAEHAVARLRAALSGASRNRLKIQLGAIDEIEAMTDDVLEIRLKGPRPNFLQLLAQPDMAIVRNGGGTGPYRAEPAENGAIPLVDRRGDADEEDEGRLPEINLRGERAALAVARFADGQADMVTGGTAGSLPLVRVADVPNAALRFDPVSGLFGLEFMATEGRLGEIPVRQALSMAVDRSALVSALSVPGLAPRMSIVPNGIEEIGAPVLPGWAALTLAERRANAAMAVGEQPLTVRVAMPDEPGYRLIFNRLRRDWQLIGVDAVRVAPNAPADLRLVDLVAPIQQAAWYLRRFVCGRGVVCVPQADDLLGDARTAQTPAERQQHLSAADGLLTGAAPFIPLTAPVRWSLVSQRLVGFQPNPFARHFPGSLLVAPR